MNIAALKFRDFRIYLAGNTFALNGIWMQRVTIGWIAWDLTSSPGFVGLVAFASFAPTMITGPLFGVLIDRVAVKRAAIITQSLLLLLALAMFISFTMGLLGPVLLTILTALSGVVASAYNPVRMSLAPRLVAKEAVASLIALTAINFNIARLSGPALAGWIIATKGVGTTLWIQTLCFLPYIFAIFLLHPRERNASTKTIEPFFTSLITGARHAYHTPVIRQALILTGLFAFTIRGTLEILPVLADGVFGKGPAGLGLLTTSTGVGALLAGLTKAMLPSQQKGGVPRLTLVCALIGIGLVPLLGNSSSWTLSLILVSLMGYTVSIAAISVQTAIQIDLDDEIRGRVMSLWVMAGIGAAATGAGTLGLVTDITGYTQALTAAGTIGFLFLAVFVAKIW